MERKPRRQRDEREGGEVVAFSVFFKQPIIFTDPNGQLDLEEPAEEASAASAPEG